MATRETFASSDRATDPQWYLGPIDILRWEHERSRTFCERLDCLIDDIHQVGYQELATKLLEFAVEDLPRCLEDETELLAPTLLQRCALEDGPKEVVAKLLRQHRSAARLAADTIGGLDRLAVGASPTRPLDFIVAALQLAEILRRQFDWEDRVLLPLAAARLTEDDQKSLGSSMGRRRGVI